MISMRRQQTGMYYKHTLIMLGGIIGNFSSILLVCCFSSFIFILFCIFQMFYNKHACTQTQSCPTLCKPLDHSLPLLSIVLSCQEHWKRIPFSLPGGLSDPGTQPMSPVTPALQAESLPLRHLKVPTVSMCCFFSTIRKEYIF